jgi:hypothetical protein
MVFSDHKRIDERSLAFHAAIAERIKNNPELINTAKETIARWELNSPHIVSLMKKWKDLLSGPIDILVQKITSQSEEMTNLRQSTPFTRILTPAERKKIYETFTVRAYYQSSRNNS